MVNSTTAMVNSTTAMVNSTTAMVNSTTATGSNTTAPPTHMPTTGNNATVPGNNATVPGNNATVPGNNATVPGNNATVPPTHAPTTGNNTVPNVITTAAPLTPNITVTVLETPVSRAECGSKQLCAAQPSDCNPSSPGSCFFLAARQTSGRNFEFGLSGQSEGYLAASLSTGTTAGGNDTTYVCANNNGVVQFFSTVLNNGQLIVTTLNVNSVKGSVNGNTIQCTFSATIPEATRARARARAAAATSFSLSVSTGSFNATTGTLGAPTTAIKTPVVNLANPNTTVTNELAPTTTSAPSTNLTTTGNQATVAPLTPNITVTVLETPVSRAECGSKQLCAAQPSDCNPSSPGSCFFLAARQTNGRNFEFGLSGQSEGYLAASLSTDTTAGGNDVTYVCANNNGVVKFFSTVLNNGQLTVTTLNVNSVKGSVNGSKIQCTFAATVPDASATRATNTDFSMAVLTGTFNAATDSLGAPSTALRTPVVNLANPNATVTNIIATTTAPATTSHAATLQQSLTQALLVTVGVLGLVML
ncbi:hypothetical protein PAMP_015888 [Pampus punctatissimus]